MKYLYLNKNNMAKKIIRLTESDLTRIVKRVIEEQEMASQPINKTEPTPQPAPQTTGSEKKPFPLNIRVTLDNKQLQFYDVTSLERSVGASCIFRTQVRDSENQMSKGKLEYFCQTPNRVLLKGDYEKKSYYGTITNDGIKLLGPHCECNKYVKNAGQASTAV